MELSYKTNKLQRSLTTDKGLAKTYGVLAKKLKLRINQLESAETLEVISRLPVLRLHRLLGKERRLWSIDVQENWRILFELDHDPLPYMEDGGVDIGSVTKIRIAAVEDLH